MDDTNKLNKLRTTFAKRILHIDNEWLGTTTIMNVTSKAIHEK